MRLTVFALAAALTASVVVAESSSHAKSHRHHHNKRAGSCPKRGHGGNNKQKVIAAAASSSSSSSSSSEWSSPSSTYVEPVAPSSATEEEEWKVAPTEQAVSAAKENPKKEQKEDKEKEEWSNPSTWSNSEEWKPEPTSTSSAWTEQPTQGSNNNGNNNGNNNSGSHNGLPASKCGPSGATSEVSKNAGPNGDMFSYLNCGLYDGGWTPPELHIDQVQVMALDEALEEDHSPFKACAPYLHLFNKYAGETGIPPIMIASIAMQESTCNPSATGGGGEVGMMQITREKCSAGVDCYDPDYNIKTGTYYFKSRLDANNGNVLKAIGQYNGWYEGLTVAKATAIKGSCCKCQNNLNYMQQMLNGWCQNIDGHTLGDWDMGC